MATASIAANPLVAGILPSQGAARWLAEGGLVVGGTLLLALSAKTKLVLGPVDMSLQSLAVLLIAATFGFRLGVATLLLYLAEGLALLPVFQGTPERGLGYAYMIGPTGGFLLGFVAMAAIVGWAVDRGWGRNIVKLGAAMLLAEVVMMAMGFGWFATLAGSEKAWAMGVQPFIAADVVKVALAAALVPAAAGLIRR